jgi:hypothetical protein
MVLARCPNAIYGGRASTDLVGSTYTLRLIHAIQNICVLFHFTLEMGLFISVFEVSSPYIIIYVSIVRQIRIFNSLMQVIGTGNRSPLHGALTAISQDLHLSSLGCHTSLPFNLDEALVFVRHARGWLIIENPLSRGLHVFDGQAPLFYFLGYS